MRPEKRALLYVWMKETQRAKRLKIELPPHPTSHPKPKKLRQKGSRRKGFLYFARDEKGIYIKVGFTERPNSRQMELSRPPIPMEIFFLMPGAWYYETAVKILFKNFVLNGKRDWFRNNYLVERFIKRLPESPPVSEILEAYRKGGASYVSPLLKKVKIRKVQSSLPPVELLFRMVCAYLERLKQRT